MNFAMAKWAIKRCSVGFFCFFSLAGAGEVHMRPDGPDAERLGMKQGYPVCAQALTRPECRVGTWSANEKVPPVLW
jgi:hypothetical protein